MAGTQPKQLPDVPKYWYGHGIEGWNNKSIIHAYTPEEWGLGGNNPSGGNYRARTFTGLSVVTVLMTIPAILAPLGVVFGLIALLISFPDPGDIGMGLITIVGSLLCTALFTGGWVLSIKALREEWQARKLRKAKGLPKPLYAVTDDQARRWFEEHPGTLEITRENFPNSTSPFPGEPGFIAPERTDRGPQP
ncbi:hypothetical protein TV39_02915 [Arthrobacter sp. SPG23]|uniref:hypothetical protein n=1 Tax=Arthrobacter sp. SPG23 TaxID=1610703 RepID=UPI0005BA963A|nr:hypothetical protein [Arthrobacter sp. SPG23]KIS28807.1 hypothetical protein TV39_02915 [Arthrobacter sp. SPG23]